MSVQARLADLAETAAGNDTEPLAKLGALAAKLPKALDLIKRR